MRAPVRMLDGRAVIVVVIVVLRQVDVRRRQHRRKHDRPNEQQSGCGPANPGGNHAENLTPVISDTRLSAVEAVFRSANMELHLKTLSGGGSGRDAILPRGASHTHRVELNWRSHVLTSFLGLEDRSTTRRDARCLPCRVSLRLRNDPWQWSASLTIHRTLAPCQASASTHRP